MTVTIQMAGGEAAVFEIDATDPIAVEAMVAFAEKNYGALHLAVNNAGIGRPGVLTREYPPDGWQQVIDINLTSVFHCTRYEIAAMLRAGGGAVVNMASILRSVGFARSAAYVAAKHGLLVLTKAAALKYAAQSFRVAAIGPGFIDTPLLSKNLEEATLQHTAGVHPIGRLGRSEEVAALTCPLLSDRASFTPGSFHLVDGGYVAQ